MPLPRLLTVVLEHDFSEDLKLQNQTQYGRTVRDSVITAPRMHSCKRWA